MYGHIQKLAEQEQTGIEASRGKADLFQIAETLQRGVLDKMDAPNKSTAIPTITPDELEKYDAFLRGVPTWFGYMPALWKTFLDSNGPQWQKGAFWGKYVGVFISTSTMGGGQKNLGF